MKYLGLDVGSTVCKLVIIDENARIVYKHETLIMGDVLSTVDKILRESGDELDDVVSAGITGSSRNLVGKHLKLELVKSEVIAHSVAVTSRHEVGTLIEIGGQDAKCVTFYEGMIQNFRINSSCGAGTGAFIESQCRRLGVAIEELDGCLENADEDIEISGKCGVFIESAVINCQKMGVKRENILKAVCKALVVNYFNEFCEFGTLPEPVWFQGGVARIKGLKDLFEEQLGVTVNVDEDCNYMGAYGMSLMAKKDPKKGSFKKFKLESSDRYTKKYISCGGCKENCSLLGYYLGDELAFKVGGRCGKY